MEGLGADCGCRDGTPGGQAASRVLLAHSRSALLAAGIGRGWTMLAGWRHVAGLGRRADLRALQRVAVAFHMADSPPNGSTSRRRRGSCRKWFPREPGWWRRSRCFTRQIAVVAGWNSHRRPRQGPPRNGPRSDDGRVDGPLDLIEFYRTQGARFVADLAADRDDRTTKGLA